MIDEFIKKANSYGRKKRAFFFLIDFDCKNFIISSSPKNIVYDIDGIRNFEIFSERSVPFIDLEPKFVNYKTYKDSFLKVIEEIKRGNTYLLNLTFKTELSDSLNLEEIFYNSNARFKILLKDKFVCFSPERFIKIEDNLIQTHPMKGTIDAKIKNAKETILSDSKESSEHLMVVDLLRNDLNMVSTKVRVEKFRYIQKIKTGKKELLQVSSKITGQLEKGWQNRVGNILVKLLPAGSISGTPKIKTVEIIKSIENYERGFFTGVFGYFDGESLDSAVAIRYIEKAGEKFFYKSGGGITLMSDVNKEYQEMKDKVYVPLF